MGIFEETSKWIILLVFPSFTQSGKQNSQKKIDILHSPVQNSVCLPLPKNVDFWVKVLGLQTQLICDCLSGKPLLARKNQSRRLSLGWR